MRFLIILLSCFCLFSFDVNARSTIGTYRYSLGEMYGVIIGKDSGLVDLGEVINFEIKVFQGGIRGKLQVFSITTNEKKNLLCIFGHDVVSNKSFNFCFPLN